MDDGHARHTLVLVALVAVVVIAGCTAPLSAPADSPGADDRELGSINGFGPDDEIEIGDPEALTRAELEAVSYRAMARIEVIRGVRFTEDVEIAVYTREEVRERFDRGDEPADAFTNELWRAPFIVDDETDVNEAFETLYGDAVQGFYVNNRVVVVTDDPEAIRISRDTLVHELTHALQDQHVGLERRGSTLDERRAETGLIEGEANYLPYLYEQRCDVEWECLPDLDPLEAANGSTGDDLNVGLFLSIFAPYSEGATFVEHLHQTGGWEAIDDAFENRPVSTSQLIHPERYPDDRPRDVALEDRSSGDWEPITDEDGEIRTETIGEATLFAGLWTNAVLEGSLFDDSTPLSPYTYDNPVTAAWAGDTFVAYEAAGDGAEGDGPTGHVWALEWESEAAAERFADTYRHLLEIRGGTAVDDSGDTYRISDDDRFSGAYKLTVDGDRVEIVAAPTVTDLEAIRPAEDGTLETRTAVGVPDAASNVFTADAPTATASISG
ncbi:Hvo_1808 family surface protein [Halobacteria archaeon AArc-curdl1]|uniref:Hvo_1808 family surface protein n=1 Tax=Natronosalvus hydrolyticus TaxID=2979988 RepID=A0AAP2ZAD6_9EURY|nr:Hvo_1808 family surface protein [Halobacteria archaeon AArc-curdl1]